MAVYPISAGSPDYSGTFLPEIWSSRINYKFYDQSVIPAISNTDWEGEISDSGEKVIIRQIPDITVRDYVKGQDLVYEQPESENVELLIDKGHYWAVRMDDVDRAQADINWLDQFSSDAASQLKIKVDTTVLGNIFTDIAATNKGASAGTAGFNMGVTGTPVAIDETNIIKYIINLGTLLDETNTPEQGRWLLLPPVFAGLVKQSDIKDASLSGDPTSIARTGRLGMIDRFEVYNTNLLTGVTEGSNTAYHLMAGHKSGLAFASQVVKTERLRAQTTFGELLRGLKVYGFKVNKPDLLADLYAYAA